jgi:hypothetical protein
MERPVPGNLKLSRVRLKSVILMMMEKEEEDKKKKKKNYALLDRQFA